ncbi:hypothetical protein [Thiomonas sp. X19]|uniref:hypothetical protein n=1 Tax=Thiomonas sp. X19 TaxID=1050370 RepID=UPI001E6523A0|nr:hypothetical protein [Thiomonas sp. X19]
MVPLRQTRKGFGIRHAHAVQDFPLVVATVDIAFRTEIWMIQPNAWKHDHGGGWDARGVDRLGCKSHPVGQPDFIRHPDYSPTRRSLTKRSRSTAGHAQGIECRSHAGT